MFDRLIWKAPKSERDYANSLTDSIVKARPGTDIVYYHGRSGPDDDETKARFRAASDVAMRMGMALVQSVDRKTTEPGARMFSYMVQKASA